MKITRSDLRYLAAPAAIALIVVLAGAATVLTTQSFVDGAQADLDRAKAERAALQKKVMHATEEESEIRARMGDYQALLDRGVIGEERRLDWLDTVKNVKNELGIFDVRYVIEAQRPVEYPGYKPSPGVELMGSRMRLQTELLHEGDLFNMLADLRAKLAPYVVVHSCALSHEPQARSDAYGPHIRSECILDLITIRDEGVGRMAATEQEARR